jgi:hypothetical protein
MHNLVEALQDMTERMAEQIDHVSEEQILFFIDQRELIVQQLQSMNISESDKQHYGTVVGSLLKHDPIILGKLEQLHTEAASGLQRVNFARLQTNAYQTAYTPDSYYFDKRK